MATKSGKNYMKVLQSQIASLKDKNCRVRSCWNIPYCKSLFRNGMGEFFLLTVLFLGFLNNLPIIPEWLRQLQNIQYTYDWFATTDWCNAALHLLILLKSAASVTATIMPSSSQNSTVIQSFYYWVQARYKLFMSTELTRANVSVTLLYCWVTNVIMDLAW